MTCDVLITVQARPGIVKGSPERSTNWFLRTKDLCIPPTYINIVKLREREGQRVDLGRSLKGKRSFIDMDGGWWLSFP